MNFTTKIAVAGVLLAAMAMPAYAAKDMANEDSGVKVKHGKQPHGGMSGKKGKPHGGMMGGGMMGGRDIIATFDADGDGRVTQAEVDEYRGSRLAEFDTDGNASLTLSEYEALWLAAMREKMVDRFQVLDADGDRSEEHTSELQSH